MSYVDLLVEEWRLHEASPHVLCATTATGTQTFAELEFPREHHKKQPHEASNRAHNQDAL
jgi:hypothetical protein